MITFTMMAQISFSGIINRMFCWMPPMPHARAAEPPSLPLEDNSATLGRITMAVVVRTMVLSVTLPAFTLSSARSCFYT